MGAARPSQCLAKLRRSKPLARSSQMKHFSLITSVVIRYGMVAAVGVGVSFAAFHERVSPPFGCTARSCCYSHESGWPLTCSVRLSSHSIRSASFKNVIESGPRRWAPLAVSVDVMSGVVLVFCSFVVARYGLRYLRRFQFSIASLMYLMFVIAILCSIARYELDPITNVLASFGGGLNAFYPITLYPMWVSVPVVYGMGCVTIVAYVGAMASLRRVSVRGRRVKELA
jgi:hypothetical protein